MENSDFAVMVDLIRQLLKTEAKVDTLEEQVQNLAKQNIKQVQSMRVAKGTLKSVDLEYIDNKMHEKIQFSITKLDQATTGTL